MKLLGAALVLLGCGGAYARELRVHRRELLQMQDLAEALLLLESMIRWQKMPIPEALRALEQRKATGAFFAAVRDHMKSEYTLQEAWIKAEGTLCKRVRAALPGMEWAGDPAHLEGRLHFAAERLAECARREGGGMRQWSRLLAAGLFSAAGLLITLLL